MREKRWNGTVERSNAEKPCRRALRARPRGSNHRRGFGGVAHWSSTIALAWAITTAGPAGALAQAGEALIGRFLRDSIRLDRGQLADLERGRAVSKVLPSDSSRDVTVFGIIAVRASGDQYGAYL